VTPRGAASGDAAYNTIQFAPWPEPKAAGMQYVHETQALYAAVTAGRQLRSDNSVDPKKKVQFVIQPGKYTEFFRAETAFLAGILNAESVSIDENYTPTGLTPSLVTTDATIFMVGAVDPVAERQKLAKQLADVEKQIAGTEAKLANESFVQRAAPIAVQREREKLLALREQREKIQTLLRALA
jgi:valyl-tRNA synthetase